MADEKVDNRVPTLKVTMENAPLVNGYNFIGMDMPKAGGGDSHGPTPPEGMILVVSTADIRAAEQALIHAADDQVAQFEAFKKQVLKEESWVFLVDDPKDMKPYQHERKYAHTTAGMVQTQQEGYYADFKDPDPSKTQKTIDGQHSLLRAVGDSIESIGQFAAALNNAAQLYALADERSFPSADTIPDH